MDLITRNVQGVAPAMGPASAQHMAPRASSSPFTATVALQSADRPTAATGVAGLVVGWIVMRPRCADPLPRVRLVRAWVQAVGGRDFAVSLIRGLPAGVRYRMLRRSVQIVPKIEIGPANDRAMLVIQYATAAIAVVAAILLTSVR